MNPASRKQSVLSMRGGVEWGALKNKKNERSGTYLFGHHDGVGLLRRAADDAELIENEGEEHGDEAEYRASARGPARERERHACALRLVVMHILRSPGRRPDPARNPRFTATSSSFACKHKFNSRELPFQRI